MAASFKQLAANRRNARKSTGPNTDEGKARSRANAVKHGLAGAGIALPTEDDAEVRRRFSVLDDEMAPSGMLGELLVHRVALMSVRLDRSARHESKALAEKVRHAEADFDEARAAEADHLLGRIMSEPISHRRKLMRTPEGTDRLIDALLGLKMDLCRTDRFVWEWNHTVKLEAYFGRRESDVPHSRGYILSKVIAGDCKELDPEEIAHLSTHGEKANWAADGLVFYINAELERLRAHRETLDFEAIALDRAEAAERAMFDPSKEATLARRYERAAEREFYRALHEFRAVEAGEEPAPGAQPDDEYLAAGDAILIASLEGETPSEPIEIDKNVGHKTIEDNALDAELGSFGKKAIEAQTAPDMLETSRDGCGDGRYVLAKKDLAMRTGIETSQIKGFFPNHRQRSKQIEDELTKSGRFLQS